MRAHPLHWLAVLALAGCAAPAPMTKGEPPPQARSGPSAQVQFQKLYPRGVLCTQAPCAPLMVTVKAGCVISVDPPTQGVAQGLHDVKITWKIDPRSAGVVAFTKAGINPKPPPGPWNSEFKNGTLVGATEFTWIDTNRHEPDPAHQKRSFGYNVDVTQGGRPCARYDPIIINDF